ncbi:MAG: acyclic terpene utilization AtuA family protein [Azospirillaceae bacterium]
MTLDQEFVIVSHGMLGYGFPKASLDEAVARGAQLIAVDAGSTDMGPYYLGSGRPFVSRSMVARDLDLIIDAQDRTGAKIVIGSAGGAGTDVQVDFLLDTLTSVLKAKGLRKKVAVIRTELDKATLHGALTNKRIHVFETERDLTPQDIDASTHVVAQIGLEPIMAALDDNPDIVVSGRAWDVSNVAALPVKAGFPRGLALHLGKILECGGQAALPVEGSDLLMGRLYPDRFIVESPHPNKACTTESIAAHTLYEKTNPVLLPGPGGTVDLRAARFTQIDDTRVEVRDSAYTPASQYTVKLEGARLAGYRHFFIGGIRDPRMIEQIDAIEPAILDRLKSHLGADIAPEQFRVSFRRYGRDGVMGPLEPVKDPPHEIGMLVDIVGETPEIAETVCAMARALLLHWGYQGRKATAGNLAFPFSPADMAGGEVYEFNVYHLMDVDDPVALFPHHMTELG